MKPHSCAIGMDAAHRGLTVRRTSLAVIIALALLFPCLARPCPAADDTLPAWDSRFPSSQEIIMPYDTGLPRAKNQSIDLPITFHSSCWTKDPIQTSVRVACWNGMSWVELPSQIYSLQPANDTSHIRSANVVFLIPSTATGQERYFLFYNANQTPATAYTDHLSVVDATYQFAPIKEISAEAHFYGIVEDGYSIYGIGQEGKILDRACAQVVVKQHKGTKTFDALNADQFVSYAFSYYYGSDEKDESSSDQVFLAKQILVDGTLMVSVKITSQSSLGDVRTTNEYRYYYTPSDDKRIYVHAKHEMLKAATVQGIDNVDGRFGSIISIRARSSTIDALNMGDISPLLDFNGTTQPIEEYQMDTNPETTDREWIIPYQDNADLGPGAWLSYGDGPTGRANAVIFANNTGLITQGAYEHDGIQLKVAEKQYFNFLGTQVDYASINFGRNSYDPGRSHDTSIPANLIVQFDAETFYTDTGGYTATQQEAHLFQSLMRNHTQNAAPPTNATRYNLTVSAYFGGTFLTFPWLAQHSGNTFPTVTMQLYRNDTYLATVQADRTVLTSATAHFPNITADQYLIKVYLKISNTRFFIGAAIIPVNTSMTTQIFCTWERAVKVTVLNQYNRGIPAVTIRLQNKDGITFDHNTTDATGILALRAPYNAADPYTITALYKERPIYTATLPVTLQYATASITLSLYNLSIKVVDTFNLPPAVNVSPQLLIQTGNQTSQILPDQVDQNYYRFTNLFAGNYTAQLFYRSHIDACPLEIPQDGTAIQMLFTQTYPVSFDLYDIQGNPITANDIMLRVLRNNTPVYSSLKHTFTLPPAQYQILLYSQSRLIATKTLDLTSEHHSNIVTSLDAQLPPVIIAVSAAVFLAAALLAILRKIRLRTVFLTLAFVLMLLAIVQPWWELAGTSTAPSATRHIAMFVQPGVLMETITNPTTTERTMSLMPQQFTSFLGLIIIGLIVTCGVVLVAIGVSLQKKHIYSLIIQLVLIGLLVSIAAVYVYGTAILTDIGIGSLQGSGPLQITVDGMDLTIPSSWGLSTGFYLIILAVVATAVGFSLTLLEWRKKRQS